MRNASISLKMLCKSLMDVSTYQQIPMKNVFIEHRTALNFQPAINSMRMPVKNPPIDFWSKGKLFGGKMEKGCNFYNIEM